MPSTHHEAPSPAGGDSAVSARKLPWDATETIESPIRTVTVHTIVETALPTCTDRREQAAQRR